MNGKTKTTHELVDNSRHINGVVSFRRYAECDFFENVMPTLDAVLEATSEDDYYKIPVVVFRFMCSAALVNSGFSNSDLVRSLIEISEVTIERTEDTLILRHGDLICYTAPELWDSVQTGQKSFRTRRFLVPNKEMAESWILFAEKTFREHATKISNVPLPPLVTEPEVITHSVSEYAFDNFAASIDETRDYVSFNFGSKLVSKIRTVAGDEVAYMVRVSFPTADIAKTYRDMFLYKTVSYEPFVEIPALSTLVFPGDAELCAIADLRSFSEKATVKNHTLCPRSFMFFDKDAALEWLSRLDESFNPSKYIRESIRVACLTGDNRPVLSEKEVTHSLEHVDLIGKELYTDRVEELNAGQCDLLRDEMGITVFQFSLAARSGFVWSRKLDLLKDILRSSYVKSIQYSVVTITNKGSKVYALRHVLTSKSIEFMFSARIFFAATEAEALRWTRAIDGAFSRAKQTESKPTT